ncbi:MAG: DUF5666 domain-containing protein [Gammaproteobacteria bacterium]|nr:DUF5666 domain-containing protein [Gammaproteobacteria bacterium]
MKNRAWKLILPLLLTSIMVACGGSGGLAGIGGSGYTSTGTVTGFGSVFVNGVEFETLSTSFDIEDNSGSQADLRIGMVVQVDGSINPDGITGTASRIRYGDQLEGPVAVMEGASGFVLNGDVTTKSFRVMGTNAMVDSVDTVFEGTDFSFDSIALTNAVEISGYYDQNDILHATYIKRTAVTFDPTSTVEIEGVISNLEGSSFNIRNVNINASAANLSDLPNGLQNGLYVEVKGKYDSDSNTITASEVEKEDLELHDDGSEVSLEGYITRYVSNSDFDINGYPVNASAASFEPATLSLHEGLKVEAEGNISNGVLIATEIETRGGDAEIHATIAAIDISTNSFTLNLALGQPLTVLVTTATTLEDELYEIEPFSLVDLTADEFVEVVGFETDTDTVTATKVKRRLPGEKTVLQGYATAVTGDATAGSVTILGVIFNFDTNTAFENDAEISMTTDEITALLATITATPTLLKVSDSDNNGTAEEIDLE